VSLAQITAHSKKSIHYISSIHSFAHSACQWSILYRLKKRFVPLNSFFLFLYIIFYLLQFHCFDMRLAGGSEVPTTAVCWPWWQTVKVRRRAQSRYLIATHRITRNRPACPWHNQKLRCKQLNKDLYYISCVFELTTATKRTKHKTWTRHYEERCSHVEMNFGVKRKPEGEQIQAVCHTF